LLRRGGDSENGERGVENRGGKGEGCGKESISLESGYVSQPTLISHGI